MQTCISLVVVLLVCSSIEAQNSKSYVNPSILQDSRNLPQTDGSFGFLYRTEDGISHAAVGDTSGQVHGRFTYTDPTGLKVNYNYNAGSRTVPGQQYEQNQPAKNQRVAEPQFQSQPQPQSQQETYADYEEYPAPRQPSYTRSQPRYQSNADA